jgi:hypothetical protein
MVTARFSFSDLKIIMYGWAVLSKKKKKKKNNFSFIISSGIEPPSFQLVE